MAFLGESTFFFSSVSKPRGVLLHSESTYKNFSVGLKLYTYLHLIKGYSLSFDIPLHLNQFFSSATVLFLNQRKGSILTCSSVLCMVP